MPDRNQQASNRSKSHLATKFASFKVASGTIFGVSLLVFVTTRLVLTDANASLFLASGTFILLQMTWIFAYSILVSKEYLFPRLFGYAALACVFAFLVFAALYFSRIASPAIGRALFEVLSFQYVCCSVVLSNALFSGPKISGFLVVSLWPVTLFRFEDELGEAMLGRRPWKPWRP